MISSSLVLVAVIDTAYVGWLFNQGRVDTLWPVKLLRVLVTALVTTFYPNMLEFVIFPLLCYITHHTRENLSWLLQNDAVPICEPFSTPEVFFTVPALLLACIFVAFAIVASYLSFEVNPLSRHPMAICNGRVETLWTVFKTTAILIVFRKLQLAFCCPCHLLVVGACHATHSHGTHSLPRHSFQIILICLMSRATSHKSQVPSHKSRVTSHESRVLMLKYPILFKVPY
jgi:hypothetical protein